MRYLHHSAKEASTAPAALARAPHPAHHGAGPPHRPDEKANEEEGGEEGEQGAQLCLRPVDDGDGPGGVNAQLVLHVLQVPLEGLDAADGEPERLCVQASARDNLQSNQNHLFSSTVCMFSS